MESIDTYLTLGLTMAMSYLPNVLLAIITLVVGLWIIKRLTRFVANRLNKYDVEASLGHFLTSVINIMLKALLVLSIAGMIGIEVTSFIAILGAAGFAVGMALSGTLQNFAGGVMILIFKPFKVGDFIEAQGHSGTVRQIQIFNTILTTGDNRTIIIPNSPLSTQSMINYSTQETRRIDLVIGISYDDDIDKARNLIKSIIHADNRVLSTPAPLIAVGELADSSVNLFVRVHTKASQYWDVRFDMLEKVKKTFDKEGVCIPFPQREVHLRQVAS